MKIYEDERGRIIDVADMKFESVQIIESKAGTVRSNHYHKKGGHLLHILSGSMIYSEIPVNKGEGKIVIYNAGESVFTGPMLIHRTYFPEDTVMICCSTLKRGNGGYNRDLVRVEI